VAAATHKNVFERELVEYERLDLEKNELDYALATALHRRYGDKVWVEFPSPKTEGRWQLTSQGWVGHILLPEGLHLLLQPKVALANLFRMLEYAYDLDLHIEQDLVTCGSLVEFYERLARILAERVLSRGKRGYYRAYVPESDQLPYVRGQLDMRRLSTRPWEAHLLCHYEDHIGDVAENQLLTWTLYRIIRSGLCSTRTLPVVRKAYRSVQSFTTLQPFSPKDCVKRLYNRLNDDYEPLHALCRFFLEHSGPAQSSGEHTMLPFLIDMARLFEVFVARWLREHLPSTLRLRVQENVDIVAGGALRFRIDLVIYERGSSTPLYILDTKYKRPEKPAESDVQQVTAYCASRHCQDGVLIYPTAIPTSLDTYVGAFRVRSVVFSLDGDLDAAGRDFLASLFQGPQSSANAEAGHEPIENPAEATTHSPALVTPEAFLASAGTARPLFEAVLALEAELGGKVHWGTKGFSLGVFVNGSRIRICDCFSALSSTGANVVYTTFVTAREKIAGGAELASHLRDELLGARPWVTAGQELKYLAPEVVPENDIDAVALGLRMIAAKVSAAGLVGDRTN